MAMTSKVVCFGEEINSSNAKEQGERSRPEVKTQKMKLERKMKDTIVTSHRKKS